MFCAPGRERSCDLLLKRELLYQLSYGREVRWNKTSVLDFVPAERAAVCNHTGANSPNERTVW